MWFLIICSRTPTRFNKNERHYLVSLLFVKYHLCLNWLQGVGVFSVQVRKFITKLLNEYNTFAEVMICVIACPSKRFTLNSHSQIAAHFHDIFFTHFRDKTLAKIFLVSLNRHKNIISRRVHIYVIHDMVLKTRFRANIQYWTHQNPEKYYHKPLF